MILDVLRTYAPIVSAVAAVGSLFIWTLYAVLFYNEYRRRRASHIFIHAAGDGGPATECLIINLSQEPVHVLCSLAFCQDFAVQVQAEPDENIPITARAKQGPLASGQSLSLGRFAHLMDQVRLAGFQSHDEEEHQLYVRVAAIHGPSDLPVGACRAFLYDSSSSHVIPAMPHTKQKRSRKSSREVRQWMQACESYRRAASETQ